MRAFRRFLCDARTGATATVAAVATLMALGGVALTTDHLWLVDQRDVLKSASDAAGVAATQAKVRLLEREPDITSEELEVRLAEVARDYVLLNLQHLSPDRLEEAVNTLEVVAEVDRSARSVTVKAEANLGGMLLSRYMPQLFGNAGPAGNR